MNSNHSSNSSSHDSVSHVSLTTIRDQLIALGDPSGQQESSYWNQWFATVCYRNPCDEGLNESCNTENPSFEWYCTVDTVSEILLQYITPPPPKRCSHPIQTHMEPLMFFHPGSGNSQLPFYLQESVYWNSRHVIVDVSDLAIKNMVRQLHRYQQDPQQHQQQQQQQYHEKDKSFQFLVGNVLQPLTLVESIPANTFDAWIDKGLIDALFSGKDTHLDSTQCQRMMLEAHRILKATKTNTTCIATHEDKVETEETHRGGLQGQIDNGGTTGGGYVFIVTMAQTHSLILILQTWLQQHVYHDNNIDNNENDTLAQNHSVSWASSSSPFLWKPHLHIHELQPSSGMQRPFLFVLQKDNTPRVQMDDDDNNDDKNQCTSINSITWTLTFHTTLLHETKTIPCTNTNTCPTLDELISIIQPLLDISRQTFLQQQQEKEETNKKKKQKDPNQSNHVFTKLEIKLIHPIITNLKLIHDVITTYSWNIHSLSWYPTCIVNHEHDDTNNDHHVRHNRSGMSHTNNIVLDHATFNGLQSMEMLKYGYIQDIGYGISKLILTCTITLDDLDILCESIQNTLCQSKILFMTRNKYILDYEEEEEDRNETNHEYEFMDMETDSDVDDDDEDVIIQSIDIDWDSTIPISDARDFLPQG